MNQIYKANDQAKVCAGNNCVTVYGGAARLITGIAVTVVAISAIAAVVKMLK